MSNHIPLLTLLLLFPNSFHVFYWKAIWKFSFSHAALLFFFSGVFVDVRRAFLQRIPPERGGNLHLQQTHDDQCQNGNLESDPGPLGLYPAETSHPTKNLPHHQKAGQLQGEHLSLRPLGRQLAPQ